MTDTDHADLPPGVTIEGDYHTATRYVGDEAALLTAGIIRAEWIAGLGRLTRRIVLKPEGGFDVLDGAIGAMPHAYREHGAFSIRRRPHGPLEVHKFRTPAEASAFEAARKQALAQAEEREAWNKAKDARSEAPRRWRNCMLARIQMTEDLIFGRAVFEGIPEIEVDDAARFAAKEALTALRRTIQAMQPRVRDIEVVSNVINLWDRAYGHVTARET